MITDPLWLLLTLQIALGAFDTLYHHEFTERLAWQPSQRHELQLHGVRNLLYAVFFLGIAWAGFNGLLAWALGALLLIELAITLRDFVEEDMTRRLPASERVTHTLLALNYGAILALLLPVIADWAARPTGLALMQYGLWSVLMTLAAIGVAIFGIRDLLAARRLARMAGQAAPVILPAVPAPMSFLITGGTGFIGTRLIEALVHHGHKVTLLTRNLAHVSHVATPFTVITNLDQIADSERFDSIINLAGQPIAGGLWTPGYKAKLLNSRRTTTRNLVALMARLDARPASFISGSAIGVYGVMAEAGVDEDDDVTNDGSFAQHLCRTWEDEARQAATLGIRTVNLRTGIVLDTAGGSLGQMLFPFEFGLGGPFGAGQNWMSWITRDDLVRAIFHVVMQPEVEGPVNAVAPQPVRNAEFANRLGEALDRPARIAIPETLLRSLPGGLGQEIFLASQNIYPGRLLASGFEFGAPDIETAFTQLLRGPLAKTPPTAIAKA